MIVHAGSRWAFALVGVGGAVGGLLRYPLIRACPWAAGTFPATTLSINMGCRYGCGRQLRAGSVHLRRSVRADRFSPLVVNCLPALVSQDPALKSARKSATVNPRSRRRW